MSLKSLFFALSLVNPFTHMDGGPSEKALTVPGVLELWNSSQRGYTEMPFEHFQTPDWAEEKPTPRKESWELQSWPTKNNIILENKDRRAAFSQTNNKRNVQLIFNHVLLPHLLDKHALQETTVLSLFCSWNMLKKKKKTSAGIYGMLA